MKLGRRFLAIVMMIMMLLGMMPTSHAMIGTCPEMGMEHNWVKDSYPPDCYNDGFEGKICNVCGTQEGKWIPSPGHQLGGWIQDPNYDPPTCEEGSMEIRVCKVCGEAWEEREVPPLGHNWVWTLGYPGDCCSEGLENGECSRCGEITERNNGKYGPHEWRDWETVKEPTCTEDGLEKRECGIAIDYGMNHTETRAIPKLGYRLEDR